MARLHAEQQLLTLLQTEAVTFRDVLQMCHLWSDMPLTANLWSQLACCSSPLWWLSRRVIQDCGCSAEIFCPGFYREFAGEEEQWQFLQWRLPISSLRQGAGCDRCAVAIHGVVLQRGSLRVWQPEPWSRAGSLAPGQAARARDSDAMGLLGASNRREIRGLGCCCRRRV